MKRCIMVSGGIDSTVLRHMLLKDYPDIVTVNMPKPSSKGLRDIVDADVTIDWMPSPNDGDNVYRGTLYTVEQKLIPEYDEIWVASNKPPEEDWFQNHPLCPKRGELIPKYPNKFKTPYHDKFKWEIIQIAIDNKIDLTGTHTCSIQPKSEKHCRECFCCKERELAYTKLGLEVYWE
mgnify:CR=1 FL=1